MNKVIELVEKVVVDGNINLIAECNGYDEDGNRKKQFSRSPFTYSETMTDAEIIEDIKAKYYHIYF